METDFHLPTFSIRNWDSKILCNHHKQNTIEINLSSSCDHWVRKTSARAQRWKWKQDLMLINRKKWADAATVVITALTIIGIFLWPLSYLSFIYTWGLASVGWDFGYSGSCCHSMSTYYIPSMYKVLYMNKPVKISIIHIPILLMWILRVKQIYNLLKLIEVKSRKPRLTHGLSHSSFLTTMASILLSEPSFSLMSQQH